MILRFQKLLYNSVLPTVRELTESPDHLVIILPTLLALISNATDDEYRSLLLPELRKVLAMTRPVQVTFQHRVTYQTRFITPAFNFIAAEQSRLRRSLFLCGGRIRAMCIFDITDTKEQAYQK